MFGKALNGGAGRMGGISQGNNKASSSIEFEISNEDKMSRVKSEGSDAGKLS